MMLKINNKKNARHKVNMMHKIKINKMNYAPIVSTFLYNHSIITDHV